MKKLLLLSAFMLAALIKANNFNFKNEKQPKPFYLHVI